MLKRNFKLVYKKPIFTYLTDIRMYEVKKILLENNSDTSGVAVAIGYKNPQHFTVDFKKKFNYLPSQFRKKIDI